MTATKLEPSSAKWLSVRLQTSGCGFESNCCHLHFRFRACFEQGVPWHSGNYRLWIYPKTGAWHDDWNQEIQEIKWQREQCSVESTPFTHVILLRSNRVPLILSWWRPLSYRNQSTDLGSKSMDWFLYDNGLCHERVNYLMIFFIFFIVSIYSGSKT